MMSYFNIYTLVSLDSNTMHILKDFSRTDNSLYKCLKKIFSGCKKREGKKCDTSTKMQKKEKKETFSKYFFENQQILSYRSIFFYLFFFQPAKEYDLIFKVSQN